MKSPNRATVSKLTDLPNVGKATAGDLHVLGITHPKQLIGQNPYVMHARLCELTQIKHDVCMIDVFISIVHFMEGGKALPWWHFTGERKKALSHTDEGAPAA
ncbi:MAG: mitomycin resistance protein [Gammaproteobacteria bacterium]|nr:helix-hairpin-helix domain-containing protein [Gammaproteobacteria bacterium]NNC97253.1 mitomycin resistance protein [Gammaproteobacteria bacterium]NNM14164.1 mitomycin resistance protein [Gammaproteobacteria bacterium]